MKKKELPFSNERIKEIAEIYGTPFHLYDEKAIRENARRFLKAFSWNPGFKEYYAVKAAPNPYLLKILAEEGIGADCSSLSELILAEKTGITGENIVFTSNDTPANEFVKAKELGALINLDDISHIDFIHQHIGMPEMICFRYNPGPLRSGGNAIIGNPEEAKYGVTREQLFECYAKARSLGAKRFGIHTMIISNELNPDFFIETARMMFQLVAEIKEKLDINIEFVDLGGGIGIPYRPEDTAVDLEYLGREIHKVYDDMIAAKHLHPLKLAVECGRMITGPYGYLVAKVLHKKKFIRIISA